jgi:2-oxoglutarate dehydrogenase E2 component (dihydrolipoamide succinyltransferase)
MAKSINSIIFESDYLLKQTCANMSIVELVMPKMGESIMEATILKWHKKAGDQVKVDDTVLEIATDKVDSEVPSIVDGEIIEILYKENDVVPVGTVIARVRTEAAVPGVSYEESAPAPVVENTPLTKQEARFQAVPSPKSNTSVVGEPRFYSPLVLNIAQQEGISLSELEAMPGTGSEGRVTKADILAYVAARKEQGGVVSAPAAVQTQAATEVRSSVPAPQTALDVVAAAPVKNYGDQVEIIEMDRMRKLIAKHMVQSKQTSPHVTCFAEVDVTNMVKWRDRVKKEFEKREQEKITFMPLFIEAVVRSLKQFPLINSSLDGDKIIVKKNINIGMATALPTGNLIVPVIHNADNLNLVGLAKHVNRLAHAARNNALKPTDTQNGTFTITNVGTFGSLTGTPIINQPEVAILAIGAIKKRPVVVETVHGDSIAIRHMMYLSISFDHRIIDGSLGSTFLSHVAQQMERFNPDREF